MGLCNHFVTLYMFTRKEKPLRFVPAYTRYNTSHNIWPGQNHSGIGESNSAFVISMRYFLRKWYFFSYSNMEAFWDLFSISHFKHLWSLKKSVPPSSLPLPPHPSWCHQWSKVNKTKQNFLGYHPKHFFPTVFLGSSNVAKKKKFAV